MESKEEIEKSCQQAIEDIGRVRSEVSKVFFGHESLIEELLIALLCGGHVLLEGVPGVGKTHLIKSLSRALSLSFSRIQFTPDLMPADLIGTPILVKDNQGDRVFRFQKGPLFAHVVLADEINRATPKTQSALLEVMEEKQITVSGQVHALEEPYFVLATQNPIEMEGTYPLPEAQIDRFFFKISVPYPDEAHLFRMIDLVTGEDAPEVHEVLERKRLIEIQHLVRRVLVADEVKQYAISLVLATTPGRHLNQGSQAKPGAVNMIRYGAGPRGILTIILAGKARALLKGRFHVSKEDIQEIALPALRHRILLSFEGEIDGIETDQLIREIIKGMKT